ncbi:MAG: NAD/NADP octopine/nopaline dehydrogenase family protein [Burkholderiales bacterium]|nr:NAD/NADP octopine/nopaline dehydrogenase family protein [Burkholderiales bacterium]
MRVAILGAGAGGAAAVGDLMLAGHEVTLWNRSEATLAPFIARGGVEYDGILGEGFARPALMTREIAGAVRGAAVALVCLPTISHAALAHALAEAGAHSIPVVLNPGHTGGALEFREAYRTASGGSAPPIAEFNTLAYIARKYEPARVTVSGKGRFLRLGALPGGAAAAAAARELYPASRVVPDVLNSSLANLNMVLHAPGAVLGAAWVEATGGDFTFYVQGMTPGVTRVVKALDAERLAVARAFGHDLPHLGAEMQLYGTVEPSATDTTDLAAAISGGTANARIRAPDSLEHRYYLEDFGHGLVPFLALAAAAGVPAPTAQALLELGATLTGKDFRTRGRTARAMGIEGLDRAGLLRLVRQ